MLAPEHSTKICVLRGARHRCPQCGEGRLYRSYLKPVAYCANCGAALGQIRADDFPPWLTIILTGHLLLPFALLSRDIEVSMAAQLAFWLPATLAMTLVLLPRCKGAIIGLMWSMAGK